MISDKELLDWDFRKDVRKYIKLTKIPVTRLGRIVFKDPRWYGDVFNSHSLRKPRVKQLRRLWDYLEGQGYFSNPNNLVKYK
jgi:hypothetical protein